MIESRIPVVMANLAKELAACDLQIDNILERDAGSCLNKLAL